MREDAVRSRAANAFWNGAGNYSLEPPLLFATESDPCLYENLATGLMCRHFGAGEVVGLFESWKDDHRAARLDEVAWLVLERGAYLRERSDRPALEELRAAFLAGLSPEERELSRLVESVPARALTTFAGAREAIARLQKRVCGFDGRIVRAPVPTLHLGVSFLALASRKSGQKRHGGLLVHRALDSTRDRENAAPGGREPRGHATRGEGRAQRRDAGDRARIENCFGPLACAPEALRALERRVCTGVHGASRLWVADASRAPSPAGRGKSAELAARAEEQHRENLAFYEARRSRLDSIAEALARHLRDLLATTSRLHEPRHKTGRLDAGRAWRLDVLGDERVFSRRVGTEGADVSLDLLLDASGSRASQQAEIAAQAHVLGRAFQLCGVPVRVSAYCTLRSHTVLRFFNGYGAPGDRTSLDSVFRYYAAGFNRDGLALRALGDIIEHGLAPLETSPARRRLLVVLTDAAPMDEDGSYVGKPAVDDTAAQVRALQDEGVRVAALYTGSDDFLDDARAIYGSSLARVRDVGNLATAAQALLDALL